MSFTCTLFSDKVRCFNQSKRALYGNYIIKVYNSPAESLLDHDCYIVYSVGRPGNLNKGLAEKLQRPQNVQLVS